MKYFSDLHICGVHLNHYVKLCQAFFGYQHSQHTQAGDFLEQSINNKYTRGPILVPRIFILFRHTRASL